MSRTAMLAGTAGGIIGIFMGITGVIWSLVSIGFAVDFYNYQQTLPTLSVWLGVDVLGLYPYPQSAFLFLLYSLLLTSFLIVSCILLGVGFYGVYQASGSEMGIIGLIFGVVGGTIGSSFIILAHVFTSTNVIPILLAPIDVGFNGVLPIFVSSPNYILILISTLIIVVTFILLGSSSLAVRDTTEAPSATTAAGILSIVGACFLALYILVQPYVPPLAILGGLFTLVGFVLIFVAFILWAVVFNKSKNM
jgi:hypothetical protein